MPESFLLPPSDWTRAVNRREKIALLLLSHATKNWKRIPSSCSTLFSPRNAVPSSMVLWTSKSAGSEMSTPNNFLWVTTEVSNVNVLESFLEIEATGPIFHGLTVTENREKMFPYVVFSKPTNYASDMICQKDESSGHKDHPVRLHWYHRLQDMRKQSARPDL